MREHFSCIGCGRCKKEEKEKKRKEKLVGGKKEMRHNLHLQPLMCVCTCSVFLTIFAKSYLARFPFKKRLPFLLDKNKNNSSADVRNEGSFEVFSDNPVLKTIQKKQVISQQQEAKKKERTTTAPGSYSSYATWLCSSAQVFTLLLNHAFGAPG